MLWGFSDITNSSPAGRGWQNANTITTSATKHDIGYAVLDRCWEHRHKQFNSFEWVGDCKAETLGLTIS